MGGSGAAMGGSGASGAAAGNSGASGAAIGSSGASGADGADGASGASGAGGSSGASGASGAGEATEESEAKWKVLKKRIKKLKGRITRIEEDFFTTKNGAEDGAEVAMEKGKAALDTVEASAEAGSGSDDAFGARITQIEAGLAKAAKAGKSSLPEEKHDEMLARIKAIEDKIESGQDQPTSTGDKKTGVTPKTASQKKKAASEAEKTEDAPEEKPKADASEVGAAAADSGAGSGAEGGEEAAPAGGKNDKLKQLTARLAKLEASTQQTAAFLEEQVRSRVHKGARRLRANAQKPFKHSPEFIALRDKVFDLETSFIEKLMPGNKIIRSGDDLKAASSEVEQTPEDAAKDQDMLQRVKGLTAVLQAKLAQ